MKNIIKSFKQDKIKFIFNHNNQAKFALKALENIKDEFNFNSLSANEIKCLSDLPEGIIDNLNAICGENGSYYINSEL